MISLFCKRALEKRQYSAKETYNLIDPPDRSHPISKVGDLALALCGIYDLGFAIRRYIRP